MFDFGLSGPPAPTPSESPTVVPEANDDTARVDDDNNSSDDPVVVENKEDDDDERDDEKPSWWESSLALVGDYWRDAQCDYHELALAAGVAAYMLYVHMRLEQCVAR
ncbi:MAG: hypothetical protein ACPG1A_13360 [Halioglobus sp.]